MEPFVLITRTDFYAALIVVVLICIAMYAVGKENGRREQARKTNTPA